jgi:hypothetical protein
MSEDAQTPPAGEALSEEQKLQAQLDDTMSALADAIEEIAELSAAIEAGRKPSKRRLVAATLKARTASLMARSVEVRLLIQISAQLMHVYSFCGVMLQSLNRANSEQLVKMFGQKAGGGK